MSWMNVQINGETAAAHVSQDRVTGEWSVAPEHHADILDAVSVENGDPGVFVCKACSEMFDDETEAEGKYCSQVDGCDNPECPCDETTDHFGHNLTTPALSWFHSADIRPDESDDSVRVSITTDENPNGAFQMIISRLDDGRLIMFLPRSEEHMTLTPHGSGFIIGGN